MLNRIKSYTKIGIVYILRMLFRAFYIFPIQKNRIFFLSWDGMQYSCNPKYIFEYIYNKHEDKFSYVWCINDARIFPPVFKNITLVKKGSIRYIYYQLTSKYYFGNAGISLYIPVRKSQIVVNTWHGGGAYKRTGLIDSSDIYTKFSLKITAKELSYFISSSLRFTEVMSSSLSINTNKFLPVGMPRNDIFFSSYRDITEKVKKTLQLDMDSGIMLYAPTYRGPIENAVPVAGFDIPNALNALSKRFRKKFVCLFRRHSYFIKETNIDDNSVIDVSVYPDMQELLCAADVLITDYSSSMWDFSLTYKPCFLYVPDLENYKAERDFYVPPEKWPFPLAQTNAGIEKNILAFDNEKYREDVKRHHVEFVSYDSGSAREATADLVLNRQ